MSRARTAQGVVVGMAILIGGLIASASRRRRNVLG